MIGMIINMSEHMIEGIRDLGSCEVNMIWGLALLYSFILIKI